MSNIETTEFPLDGTIDPQDITQPVIRVASKSQYHMTIPNLSPITNFVMNSFEQNE